MAEAGAIRPRRAVWKSGHRGWQRGDAGVVARFGKPLVAASLIAGDVIAAIAAVSFSRALTEMTGTEPPDAKHLPIAFLILTFFCVRLYTGCGPSPYERFRLRTIGIVGFVAIEFLVGVPNGQSGLLLVTGFSDALHLLIFGHYVEATMRTLLIHLDLWAG